MAPLHLRERCGFAGVCLNFIFFSPLELERWCDSIKKILFCKKKKKKDCSNPNTLLALVYIL